MHNIYGSKPHIPDGMSDPSVPLTPEFFSNPSCPLSISSAVLGFDLVVGSKEEHPKISPIAAGE